MTVGLKQSSPRDPKFRPGLAPSFTPINQDVGETCVPNHLDSTYGAGDQLKSNIKKK